MLETIAVILLVLIGLSVLGGIVTFIVTLVLGNKVRKRVKAELDEPFFRDTNPVRRPTASNWRDHNGF